MLIIKPLMQKPPQARAFPPDRPIKNPNSCELGFAFWWPGGITEPPTQGFSNPALDRFFYANQWVTPAPENFVHDLCKKVKNP